MSETEIEKLRSSVAAVKDRLQSAATNADKRKLYSDSELLRMDVEALIQRQPDAVLNGLNDELAQISSGLALTYVYRPASPIMKLLNRIDQILRTVAVWLMLALASIFFALPCILLAPLDFILVTFGIISVYSQISVQCKIFLARTLLRVAGIHMEIEGLDLFYFGNECALACFSHASSMDGFLVTSTIPVNALTVCKSEIFLIPFFSWCATAFGGVPIHRENRDQAVKAMEAAASAAKLGECMAISPEGTRSLTGQLLEFKKGPFYLWDKLQTPIVPIVTLGAFELFPPGNTMTLPGKVYVRFLQPIQPHEAPTKEAMSLLLRRRMLQSLRDVPEDVCAELTWPLRLVCWLNLSAVYAATWYCYRSLVRYDPLTRWQMTHTQLWGVTAAVAVLLTMLSYVHSVYCAPVLRGCVGNSLVKRKQLPSSGSLASLV